MTLAGTVSSFDQSAFIAQLAALLGVSASDITITVSAGSITISISVVARGSPTANIVASLTQPVSALSTALGVTVQTAATPAVSDPVAVYAPSPPPPSPSPPPPSPPPPTPSPPPPSPPLTVPHPSPPPAPPLMMCTNTCSFANNGYCQDGGSGSIGSSCTFSTDCADCGPRAYSPPSPPPAPPPSPPPPSPPPTPVPSPPPAPPPSP